MSRWRHHIHLKIPGPDNLTDCQAAWTTDDIIPMLCSVMAAATTYVPNWAANLVFCSEVPDSFRHTLSYPAHLDFT